MELTITVRPLADLEATIERGLTTFVEVGQALLEIREHRLYRETHESFETYCRDRWSWSRQRAHQMIEASSVSTMVDTDSLNERQARELARLKDEPEAVREVWSEVKETHGDAVTAADVRSAVDRRLGVERTQPIRRAPDPEIVDDYVEDVNQDAEYEPTVAGLFESDPEAAGDIREQLAAHDRAVIAARAWHAALAPAGYATIDPGAVIATQTPLHVCQGVASLEQSIAYLTKLLDAARRGSDAPALLEVVR